MTLFTPAMGILLSGIYGGYYNHVTIPDASQLSPSVAFEGPEVLYGRVIPELYGLPEAYIRALPVACLCVGKPELSIGGSVYRLERGRLLKVGDRLPVRPLLHVRGGPVLICELALRVNEKGLGEVRYGLRHLAHVAVGDPPVRVGVEEHLFSGLEPYALREVGYALVEPAESDIGHAPVDIAVPELGGSRYLLCP